MIDTIKKIVTYDDLLYQEIFKDCHGLRDKMNLAQSHGLSSLGAHMYTDEMMAYYIAVKTGRILEQGK